MDSPLGDAVGAVCAALRPALAPSSAVRVDQVLSRLDGPCATGRRGPDQIRHVDEALRVDAGERDRRRRELSGAADQIFGVVTGIDELLPVLRGAR